ncbi:MAG: hypothetical protein ACJ762_04300 [Solirubrobacteraceae bacterium]
MWRSLRSRTFAPRRPAVFPEQWPLVIATVIVLLAGLALAVWGVVEVVGSLHYPLLHNIVD